MEWISELLQEQSALQAAIVLSLISGIGLGLGKIRFWGISLGITFVFFTGIFAGHLGVSVQADVLNYVETFGLVLFVYSLGLQVGPGFFNSFQKSGIRLNALAFAVIVLGTGLTLIFSKLFHVDLPNMIGVLCGATTNTPALGAAQQTLKQLGLESSSPALGCAVAYPLGVVGVTLAILLIRKIWIKDNDLQKIENSKKDETFIAEFQVHNPGIFNKTIKEIAQISHSKFIISRLWREGIVSIPTSEKKILPNDRLLVVTSENEITKLTVLFGEQELTDWNKKGIDWTTLDQQLTSLDVLITRPEINGKKIDSLRLRNKFGVNISHVFRSGVKLLATPDLVLQFGDRVNLVGEASAINKVENVLGNVVKNLNEPNLVVVFIGMVFGLLLGAIPFYIPGMSVPLKLGIAGGPIIIGLLMGKFGPRLHLITYTTASANLMLRALGLTLYLACLGLDAGPKFFETVFQPEGILWILSGFLLTIIPVLIVGAFSHQILKIDFGSIAGMLCGSMANPMSLEYVNSIIEGDNPSVSYATVYPLSMFLRVIIAQLLLLFFL
ncbi:MAG: putative transporter [Bacteroides sp.]|nr:putative transporter [Bacteroides sp.]MDD2644811.1 putative transporter [Bacteroides sp.]MDD4720072.1 putative transporter [Bacteroides sp.]